VICDFSFGFILTVKQGMDLKNSSVDGITTRASKTRRMPIALRNVVLSQQKSATALWMAMGA